MQNRKILKSAVLFTCLMMSCSHLLSIFMSQFQCNTEKKNSYQINTVGEKKKIKPNSFQSCAWSKSQEVRANAWVWLFSDPSAAANSSCKSLTHKNTSLNINKAFCSSTLQGNHLLLYRKKNYMIHSSGMYKPHPNWTWLHHTDKHQIVLFKDKFNGTFSVVILCVRMCCIH